MEDDRDPTFITLLLAAGVLLFGVGLGALGSGVAMIALVAAVVTAVVVAVVVTRRSKAGTKESQGQSCDVSQPAKGDAHDHE